jgi:hypothetical protein
LNRKRQLQIFVMLPLVWSMVLSNARAEGKALGNKDREKYRSIAYRVVDKLIASEGHDYPDLVKLSGSAKGAHPGAYREESEDRLWIAYHYTHGMSWIPNPNHKPVGKGGAKVKSFADDGVELNLYFYEGDWIGQAAVSPSEIGQMKIVVFVEGSQAARKAFGEVLSKAIEQEQRAYQKN